jgi:hypothetical protein
LKAQLVRIDYGTDLVPRGIYTVSTENEEDTNPQEIVKIEEEERKPVTLLEKTKLTSWLHQAPCILRDGRTTYVEIEEEDDVRKEELKNQRLKEDPLEMRLKPLSLDRCKLNHKGRRESGELLAAASARRPGQGPPSVQGGPGERHSDLFGVAGVARDGIPAQGRLS